MSDIQFTVRLGPHADADTLHAVMEGMRGVVIDVNGERILFSEFTSDVSGTVYVAGTPYPPPPPNAQQYWERQVTPDTIITIL